MLSQPESEQAVGETSQTHGLMVMEVPFPLDVNNVSDCQNSISKEIPNYFSDLIGPSVR